VGKAEPWGYLTRDYSSSVLMDFLSLAPTQGELHALGGDGEETTAWSRNRTAEMLCAVSAQLDRTSLGSSDALLGMLPC